MRYYVSVSPGCEHTVHVTTKSDGALEVTLDDVPYAVEVFEAEPALLVRVNERVFDLWLDAGHAKNGADGSVTFVAGTQRGRAVLESERARIGARASRTGGLSGGMVAAPMPGRVVKLLVEVGDVVDAGAPIVVIEAMKMENELSAPAAGIVQKVLVTAGTTVEAGATLVELGALP